MVSGNHILRVKNEESPANALALTKFFESAEDAAETVLLLDFDGTLAPFRIDPGKVRPWAGVVELLEAIHRTGRTRIALITGRPAGDVAAQLGMRKLPEIWGLHGAERLGCDGKLVRQELSEEQQTVLTTARAAVNAELAGARIEEKWNAVVLHWRGLAPQAKQAAERRGQTILGAFAGRPGMTLLQFDGGLELRAGPDKGDAVREILGEVAEGVPVAYLGDDITDEAAFAALQGRGLSVLVRREWRPSVAQIWLRPPEELRSFLSCWETATKR